MARVPGRPGPYKEPSTLSRGSWQHTDCWALSHVPSGGDNPSIVGTAGRALLAARRGAAKQRHCRGKQLVFHTTGAGCVRLPLPWGVFPKPPVPQPRKPSTKRKPRGQDANSQLILFFCCCFFKESHLLIEGSCSGPQSHGVLPVLRLPGDPAARDKMVSPAGAGREGSGRAPSPARHLLHGTSHPLCTAWLSSP